MNVLLVLLDMRVIGLEEGCISLVQWLKLYLFDLVDDLLEQFGCFHIFGNVIGQDDVVLLKIRDYLLH